MLKADWGLFLELATYVLYGHTKGCVAYGIEEVTEAVAQAVVTVLFVPVDCGHGGEAAVRRVAANGGRGYIVGMTHELHDDVNRWSAAAILGKPLLRLQPPLRLLADGQPVVKKQRVDGGESLDLWASLPLEGEGQQGVTKVELGEAQAAAPVPGTGEEAVEVKPVVEEPAPAPLPADERSLRRDLKILGTPASLRDSEAIPLFAAAVRDRYFPELGAELVFGAFGDSFTNAKGTAHRKAVVYVLHELMKRSKGRALAQDGRREHAMKFIIRIGEVLRGFSSAERDAYCKLVQDWSTRRMMSPKELADVRESWDTD